MRGRIGFGIVFVLNFKRNTAMLLMVVRAIDLIFHDSDSNRIGVSAEKRRQSSQASSMTNTHFDIAVQTPTLPAFQYKNQNYVFRISKLILRSIKAMSPEYQDYVFGISRLCLQKINAGTPTLNTLHRLHSNANTNTPHALM